jgi:hypothetical protein
MRKTAPGNCRKLGDADGLGRYAWMSFRPDWFGTQPGDGVKYHRLALGRPIALLAMGAGAGFLDGALPLATAVSTP